VPVDGRSRIGKHLACQRGQPKCFIEFAIGQQFVGGDVADEVIAYAQDQPHALPLYFFHGHIADKVFADAYDWPRTLPGGPALSNAQLARSGMALIDLSRQRKLGARRGGAGCTRSRKPTYRR
jgi:hypothetical protein